MTKIKSLSLLLLLVASIGIMAGSSGFSSVSAERGVSVNVVTDESAYVGYQSSDLVVRDNEMTGLVAITNRFSDEIEVRDVAIVDGRSILTGLTAPDSISSGEQAIIRGTVDCTPNQTQQVAVTVMTRGNGVTAEISGDTETREFTLTCAAPE